MAEGGSVMCLGESVDKQILQVAAQGDVRELSLLLNNFGRDASSIRGEKGRTPLHSVCVNGNVACAALLLTVAQTVRSAHPIISSWPARTNNF
jgi:ankyrin repeat protein